MRSQSDWDLCFEKSIHPSNHGGRTHKKEARLSRATKTRGSSFALVHSPLLVLRTKFPAFSPEKKSIDF